MSVPKIDPTELFLITCVAQILSESLESPSPLLEDHIELGAVLYYISHNHGMNISERRAESAVAEIRKIWRDNDGCWPDKYRF